VVCPAVTPIRVYRPRQPRASPLWQVLDRYFHDFQRVYDDRYQQRYGFWRPVIARTVEKFLTCGDLHEGFARVRCPKCRYEFFVAFSCRRRCLCPSCHQKRALVIANHIARDVCAPVCHRQFVFTVPKRLRIFLRFDRQLLGELPRLAWQTVLEVYRAVLDRSDVTPGMVAAIHTFGQVLHFHPHLHALVSDGALAPDGTFIPLPELDGEPFEKLWQRKVFDLLLKRGKINESLVQQMLSWKHSGFDVNFAVRLGPDDLAARARLAQYMLRCPFSLERMIRVTEQGKVLYLAEKRAPQRFPKPARADLVGGVARNFQIFDPLDFIAELTQHIPEPRRHLVRYFGFYSSRARGRRAKANGEHPAIVQGDDHHSSPHQARRRWAALIQQVWRVDPLECPRCGSMMKIVSFINPGQRDVIDRILTHCGLAEQPSRAPPPQDRAAPREPDPGQLRYVRDLEFVDEPAPAEGAWTAD
jgi:hypothetical protein